MAALRRLHLLKSSDMKVLLVNGSPNEHGCTFTALSEVADTLHKHGIETEMLYLGKKPVAGCIACMKCFETGHCFRDDAVRKDKEGLQTMRSLGENMAWMLRCIKEGKKNNMNKPEYEPRLRTHFIQPK